MFLMGEEKRKVGNGQDDSVRLCSYKDWKEIGERLIDCSSPFG